jgi:hypothetical protein
MASGLAAGLAQVFFEKDPRKPTQDGEKFGVNLPWPERTPDEIADLGRFTKLAPFPSSALSSLLPAQAQGMLGQVATALGGAQDALPGMSSISGWGGEIPLPGGVGNVEGLSQLDPKGLLGDVLGQGVSGLTNALPEGLRQTVAQGVDVANGLQQLASLAQNPEGLLSGALEQAVSGGLSGVGNPVAGAIPTYMPASGASSLPFPASPPFVPSLV